MSIRYEYIDTSHPFLSIYVAPDPNPDEFDGDDPGDEQPDTLVIAYDEAVVITGDLHKFARMVNKAVGPEHQVLQDEDLVRAYRGLSDESPVHLNPTHVEGLRRVESLIRSSTLATREEE